MVADIHAVIVVGLASGVATAGGVALGLADGVLGGLNGDSVSVSTIVDDVSVSVVTLADVFSASTTVAGPGGDAPMTKCGLI
jgi:hypothetical protein